MDMRLEEGKKRKYDAFEGILTEPYAHLYDHTRQQCEQRDELLQYVYIMCVQELLKSCEGRKYWKERTTWGRMGGKTKRGGKSQDEEGKGGSMIGRREGSMEGRKECIYSLLDEVVM